jgi:hypothetical protein
VQIVIVEDVVLVEGVVCAEALIVLGVFEKITIYLILSIERYFNYAILLK